MRDLAPLNNEPQWAALVAVLVEVSLRFNNKAVGPDGYPIDFFQFCWDFIREGMMELFGDFFRGGIGYQEVKLWHHYPSP
jgi:hypothetical protein